MTLSYSVTISGSMWLSVPSQTCPPNNIDPPEVHGTPAVGQTLTATNGNWTLATNNTYTVTTPTGTPGSPHR